jgi:hypothetical protein
MNRKTALIALALATASLSSCSWQEVVDGVTRTHHVVVDTDTTPFDAVHGDVVDVIVTHDASWENCDSQGCDDMVYSPDTGLTVYEGVDF